MEIEKYTNRFVVCIECVEQLSDQPGLGLFEGAPVAVEVRAVQVVAPVPAEHAIRVHQWNRHDLEPLTKTIREFAVGKQRFGKGEERVRARDLGWMLSADNE